MGWGILAAVHVENRRLGLYGAPGVGKTTVVERLVDLLRTDGLDKVGGFVTRELREAGQRAGFACHDLQGSRQAIIAHTSWDNGPQVGRYHVDVPAFESIALPALERPDHRRVVIVDELGAMELLSAAFVKRLLQLLKEPVPVVITMHAKPHPVTDELRQRSDLEMVEVRVNNRQALPGLLHRRLQGAPDS